MNYSEFVRPIDRELALYVLEQGGDEITAATASLASYVLSHGGSCIDLASITAEQLWPEALSRPELPTDRVLWAESLRRSPLVSDGASSALFTLRGSRFYLTRYFRYEKVIASRITEGSRPSELPRFSEETSTLMKNLFASDHDFSLYGGDLQLAGSLLPLFFKFCVISGGPGTGKTTTVAKLLALRLSHEPDLKIALAAPTGKAAQRMNESIQSSVIQMNSSEKTALPDHASQRLTSLASSTIHRLLGVNHLSPTFRKNSADPLDLDLLVIDEASMIDLPLLAKLLDAVPEKASVILLGDQYQLSSVEAGAVLGDICCSYKNNSFSPQFTAMHHRFSLPMNHIQPDSELSPVVQLKYSFRFRPDGGIGLVSRMINEGAGSVMSELRSDSGEVRRVDEISFDDLCALSRPIRSASSPERALEQLTCGIVLTLHNDGSFGQESINRQIQERFRNADELYCRNMPIMITENSPQRRLFNGDMGILSSDSGEWEAYFSTGGTVYRLPAVLLPKWQPAFAITIHKSQGSEYGKVIILTGDSDSPMLTRELLYTAVTRAKPPVGAEQGAVIIRGKPDLLARGVSRRAVRSSGLKEELKMLRSE